MSVPRSHRLFDLMQALRRHRNVVSGRTLASELGVSLRTIRRDISTLQNMGAHIDGEAGVGYSLRPGFLLPPLSFTAEEIQALVVGAQWVGRHTDASMARAVKDALAKIGAVLPFELRGAIDDNSIYVGQTPRNVGVIDLAQLRQAIREQRTLRVAYDSSDGNVSERTIWPIMVGFIDSQRYVACWCETSADYALLVTDQIRSVEYLDVFYARHRRQLAKEWRAQGDRLCVQHDRCD